MSLELLLSQVSMISKKYDTLYKNSGEHFNIFEVAGIDHDEVIICRVLHDLLSPLGSHCQGSVYLKLFLENVLHLKVSSADLKSANVTAEYAITNQRRIDLVIETGHYFIPIEVKIYAGEQKKQCYDYYKEACRHMNDPKIYYLTRFGTPPSDYSAEGLTKAGNSYKEVCTMSFAEDILGWLNLCLKENCTIKAAPIREIILQLMQVIRKFTIKMEDDERMEIKELLISNPEYIKSAVKIDTVLNEAKRDLMLKFFESVEAKVLAKNGKHKLNNQFDYNDVNSKKAINYYTYKTSTYPGISYMYKDMSSAGTNKDIWVRLEIENKVFVGYCCIANGKWEASTISDEDIKRVLNVEPNKSSWWAYTEYLPNNNAEMSPDFKYHNDSYFDLYDAAKFEFFTDKCADRICELLK